MKRKLEFSVYATLFFLIMAGISTASYSFGFKRDGFLHPNEKVMLGRHDTVFKVCNRTKTTLQTAIIYEHHWKYGKPPTWPAKGWFIYRPGECSNVAINNFYGMMSVVSLTKDGKLKPYYSGSTSISKIKVSNNEVKKFKTVYLCLGKAPFEGYKNDITDYRKCAKNQTKIPFNVVFRHGGGASYTLDLQ